MTVYLTLCVLPGTSLLAVPIVTCTSAYMTELSQEVDLI